MHGPRERLPAELASLGRDWCRAPTAQGVRRGGADFTYRDWTGDRDPLPPAGGAEARDSAQMAFAGDFPCELGHTRALASYYKDVFMFPVAVPTQV